MTLIANDSGGCVITTDAAGCQKLNARKVVDCKADYVFGLKGNQKNMHDEFLELFDKCQRQHPNRFATFGTVEKNGGRYERRKCIQTDYVEWFPEIDEWKGLRSVIMVGKELDLSVGDVVFKGICSREFLFSLAFGKAA